MRRLAALPLALTAVVLGAGPSLAAEGDPVTGYWTRTNPGLPVPVQAPTPVPEGGTWVAADPSGPLAVSALRTELASGSVAVELRLTIADSVGVPAVQACPSTDRWVPEQGGRLEAAPPADCSAPLEATVDGEVLVVSLPPGSSTVNVLLRPAPGSAFSLTLEPATAASVVTASEPAPFAPAPAPGPAFSPTGPAFEGVTAPPFLPAAPIAPPLLAGPQAPAPAAAAPAPAPQAAPPPAVVLQRRRVTAPPVDRTESLVAVAVLALLAVQAVRLARQPAVAPRALGGAVRAGRAEPVTEIVVPARGVGRFRTTRAGPPVRI